MEYLLGYTKYKKLVLTGGTSGAQTGFQLKISVSYAAAMQGDFDDLRFTQADGITLVDAWAEVIITDTSATVWVEFPTTPANTVEQTYYMYYGNNVVSDDWDIHKTFLIGDDFESTTINEITNPWTRYASNPVFAKNPTNPSWDYYFVNSPFLAVDENGDAYKDGSDRYYMYYSGSGNADGYVLNEDQVGLARSTDLINWTRITSTVTPLGSAHDGLVLPLGANGQFDDSDTQIGTIIVKDGTFHMWYTGNDDSSSDNLKFGYATSSDGITWTKSGDNPILSYGTVDDNDGVYAPHVILDGSTWKMWYIGKNTAGSPTFGVMYATAPVATPTVWTRYSNSYVYEHNQTGNSMWGSYVFKDGSTYNMIYINYDSLPYQFHLATSSDGINWNYEGLIFEVGESGQWDEKSVAWASQIKVGSTWYTFYKADNDAGDIRIGYATSTNRLPNPAPWSSVGSAWSNQTSIKYAGSGAAKGTYHTTTGERLLKRVCDYTSGIIYMRYRPDAVGAVFYLAQPADSSGTLYWLAAVSGHYQYHDGSWHNFPTDTTYTIGQWDKIKIVFDYSTDKYDVWINDTKISGTGIAITGAGTQLTEIKLSTYNTSGDENYIDNFFVCKYASGPPTYAFGSEESIQPMMRRWGGIPGMQYTGRRSW